MNTIIYFSNSGSTKKHLMELEGDQHEIKLKKSFPKITVFRFFMFLYYQQIKKTIEITYDPVFIPRENKVYICAPLWTNEIALPMQVFIKENLDELIHKEVEVHLSSGSGLDSLKKEFFKDFTNIKYYDVKRSKYL